MAVYVCGVCGYEYDEEQEGTAFDELPEEWVCPVCGVDKTNFQLRD